MSDGTSRTRRPRLPHPSPPPRRKADSHRRQPLHYCTRRSASLSACTDEVVKDDTDPTHVILLPNAGVWFSIRVGGHPDGGLDGWQLNANGSCTNGSACKLMPAAEAMGDYDGAGDPDEATVTDPSRHWRQAG